MRYLLTLFFFLMYAGDNLGLAISFGMGLSIKNVLLYLLFAGIALNAAVARNRSFDFPSITIPFALLIVYALATWLTVAFVIGDPEYRMREAFISLKSSLGDQYLTFLVFFFGLLTVKDAFWVLRATIWIALIGNIVTIMDAFDIPNLNIVEARMSDERFLGFIGSANGYGQFLVLFLAPSIALYLTQKGKLRFIAGIGVLASALALVLTGSRGAYLGLLAGAIGGAFYLRRMIPTEKFVHGGIIAVALSACLIVVSMALGYADVYLEQMVRFEGSAHIATSGRSTIWTNVLAEMFVNPMSFITGYGFFAYESGRFYAATHNTYLSYLYDLGIIGLFLFVLVFVRVLATARSVLPHVPSDIRPFFVALVFGLVGFLISIFFSEYHNAGYLLWAYLGVTMRIAAELQTRDTAGVAVGTEGVDRLAPSNRLSGI